MNKKGLTEADICDQFITPAIRDAGWDPTTQIRREFFFTDGRVIVRGNAAARGNRKFVDYLLFFQHNLPLAVVEAKDNNHPLGGGMQQALEYADALDVPFAISSNGDGFKIHDRTGRAGQVESDVSLREFPTPDDLWARYRAWKGFTDDGEKLARFPFHDDGSGKEPRYYQRIAIQRTVEAVARGDNRILLVMATGSGKTYTAFQIIWRLWKAGRAKRVLYLADRDILIDQPKNNDFKPFKDKITRLTRSMKPEQLKSYEVYLALYQGITGEEERRDLFRQFSPEFFDLVFVDECHRGSARDDSAWRDVLDYFHPAVQVGLTATPKETTAVSNITYFGEPLYTYSLRQGIDDGFLAPYKVVRIDLDRDLQGWRPKKGMTDDLGQEIEDRIYNQRDMDSVLVLNERTKRVAEKVIEYLKGTDRHARTIVFCEDIEHAERMRSALVNQVGKVFTDENPSKFVVRITGDSKDGKAKLDDFQSVEKTHPVIATTSKLLTTGVDVKTCKLVVLDQRIQSMIEFKQIIGRGTRIQEDAGKLWFTIMDFKKATELFSDPSFDGDPVVIYDPQPGDSPVPPDDTPPPEGGTDTPGAVRDPVSDPAWGDPTGRQKYFVSNVPVSVVAERVQFYDKDGKLVTESLKDYTKKTIREQYASLNEFLRRWSAADRKQAVIDELREQGVLLEPLQEQVGKDLDPFDLICHVAYDQPPLTRKERAEGVKKRDVFTKYGPQAKAVLEALLAKYADEGVVPDEDLGVLRVKPISDLGTTVEIVKWFGGKERYVAAVKELETALHSPAA